MSDEGRFRSHLALSFAAVAMVSALAFYGGSLLATRGALEREMGARLATFADRFAGEVAPALAANDGARLAATLERLGRDHEAVALAVYGPDGRIVTRWVAHGTAWSPPEWRANPVTRIRVDRGAAGGEPSRWVLETAIARRDAGGTARGGGEHAGPETLGWALVAMSSTGIDAAADRAQATRLIVLALSVLFGLVAGTLLARGLSGPAGAGGRREAASEAAGPLDEMQEELVRAERLRATGEMASGIAHDFNNILAAILGRVQLVRRGLEAGTIGQADLLRSLAVMELAARDGADTVRRLRRYAGTNDANASATVDLGDAVRGAAEFTRPRWKDQMQAEGRPIELAIQCEEGIPVIAQPGEIREVFTNLILNAVDAMPNGGRLTLEVARRGDRAVAVVQDSGTGMPPEVRERIFEPFFSTKDARGTGLGLSITMGIIRRLRGTIEVESAPGAGTRFQIVIPIAEERAGRPRHVPGRSELPEGPQRLLIVDDEIVVLDLLRDILHALGHEVTTAQSVDEALSRWSPGGFDGVLTDLGIPGRTGWDLIAAIRERDESSFVAIVTGWADQVTADQMMRGGADAILPKPFAIEDVERLLALLAAHRRARAA